jgi:hypothetical protein
VEKISVTSASELIRSKLTLITAHVAGHRLSRADPVDGRVGLGPPESPNSNAPSSKILKEIFDDQFSERHGPLMRNYLCGLTAGARSRQEQNRIGAV